MHSWEYGQFGVFTFIVLIVFIGGLFSFLKARSAHETIREAVRAGKDLDPEVLRSLGRGTDGGPAGFFVGGVITIAVAIGLAVFGHQIGAVEGDAEVAQIFLGIAAIPACIGVALLLVGTGMAVFARKREA